MKGSPFADDIDGKVLGKTLAGYSWTVRYWLSRELVFVFERKRSVTYPKKFVCSLSLAQLFPHIQLIIFLSDTGTAAIHWPVRAEL